MSRLISVDELYQLLQDESTTEADIRPYVIIAKDRPNGFTPVLLPNPDTVEEEELEGAFLINAFNGFSKRSRQRRYRRKITGGWNGIKMVSEGDSWFQYPILLDDIIDHLFNDYAIYSLGSAGDLLREIIEEDEISDAIRRENPDVFLISGGGNDMVGGGRMATMVHGFDVVLRAEEYPNDKFNDFLEEITNFYRGLFDRLLTRHKALKIVTHGYDRAIPNNGRWLGKPLNKRGIRDQRLQRDVVAVMIDRFNEAMKNVSADFRERVFHADCRGSVADDRWNDELHPTDAGYGDAAEVFRKTIEAAVTGRSLPVTETRYFHESFRTKGMLLPKRKTKVTSPPARLRQLGMPSQNEFLVNPHTVQGFVPV